MTQSTDRPIRTTDAKPAIDLDGIEALAALIIAAERPCVLFGSELQSPQAIELGLTFCRELDLPAYRGGVAPDTFPTNDTYSFEHSRPQALAQTDLVILLGVPADQFPASELGVAGSVPVVRIDFDGRAESKPQGGDLTIAGDCGAVIQAVLDTIGHAESTGAIQRETWIEHLRTLEKPAAAASALQDIRIERREAP
ncbi:MAG TPA: hypothetical protein VM689_08405 [Aliidongia sp.]|nr:hypothetical protein [Aliidongia sp.]